MSSSDLVIKSQNQLNSKRKREGNGKSSKGTKTHQNLKDAFAGESQANRRYLYFAKIADVEGHRKSPGCFATPPKGETGHAHGISTI